MPKSRLIHPVLMLMGLFVPCLAVAQVGDATSTTADNAQASPSTQTQLADCFASLTNVRVNFSLCEEGLENSSQWSVDGQGSLAAARFNAALGALHLRKNALDRARFYLDTAIQLHPNDPIVVGNYANLLLREGAFVSAIETYNRLLSLPLDPQSMPAVYLNRSLALRATGRYDEAAKDTALYLAMVGVTASSFQSQTETGATSTSSGSGGVGAYQDR